MNRTYSEQGAEADEKIAKNNYPLSAVTEIRQDFGHALNETYDPCNTIVDWVAEACAMVLEQHADTCKPQPGSPLALLLEWHIDRPEARVQR